MLIVLRVQGHNLRHALVVGRNSRSEEICAQVNKRKKLGYNFKGYVDIHKSVEKKLENDVSFACDLAGFQEYVRKNVVDEIFLFLPIKSFYKELNDIIAICEEQGIIVRMRPDFFELKSAKARIEPVGRDELITLLPVI